MKKDVFFVLFTKQKVRSVYVCLASDNFQGRSRPIRSQNDCSRPIRSKHGIIAVEYRKLLNCRDRYFNTNAH